VKREMDSAVNPNRSPELDEVRRMLFPGLSPDDGWARIDQAFRGAADPRKQAAIEALAGQDLPDDVFSGLRLPPGL
jgi:hypothetical protein